MKKNNTLLIVNNLNIILEIKRKVNNVTFLFPLEDFCVGFPNTFKLSEIKEENAYIFVNRILDNKGINEIRKILLNLPSNIKGIVFDDIGILNILQENKISLCKILFLNHFNCNYESIKAFLEYVDSVVVSPDITIKEIDEIIKKVAKPLVLYTFGHVNIMYSRRLLLTNYNDHFKKNVDLIADLEEDISHTKFKMIENKYGTVIYTEAPFNGLTLRNRKCLFNLINSVFLSDTEILNILTTDSDLLDKYPYEYLSGKETIFKLKGDKND